MVESSGGTTIVAPVAPLSWPGTDPELRLLAEVDGRAGLEPVVALSPEAVYRPGAVFTMREGGLRRMRLIGIEPSIPDDLFPFDDEFPAGVDCTAEPGSIVVTFGAREQRAARLVEAHTGEPVECKDNGGVNVGLHPEFPVGYSCYNEAGEFYNAMVSPDGVLLSLTRPVRLKPEKS